MLKVLLLCLCLVVLPGPEALAVECPLEWEEPVLITSVGQSLDALIIKAIFDEMGIKADFLPLAKGENLRDYERVIILPGISYKGIAAAGITLQDEVNRATELLEAACDYSCHLTLIYLGGFITGDSRSQQLIQVLAPNVDAIIIYNDNRGPIDYFLQIARAKNVPIFFIDSLGNLCEELASIFSR